MSRSSPLILRLVMAAVILNAGCSSELNAPKNGMLVINREETVAVAFCPENSFLLKKGQAIVFPGRYVKRNDKWEPDPVEPGPDLVPVPDCVHVVTEAMFTHFAEAYQYRGSCSSQKVKDDMKRRFLALGVCEGHCQEGLKSLSAKCG